MNIREKIGQRIRAARKSKGLTRKALGELTEDLKQSRINGWERGARIPGPEEIKLLARVLEVSPSYLMCLSDENKPENIPDSGVMIPLLDAMQAYDFKSYIEGLNNQNHTETSFIPLNSKLHVSEYTFALKIQNDSMTPEMRANDIQVVDPQIPPNPGDFVAVRITGKPEVIVCQYRKLSYTSPEFELLTLNDNWPNITVSENLGVEIIGKVIQNIRTYLCIE